MSTFIIGIFVLLALLLGVAMVLGFIAYSLHEPSTPSLLSEKTTKRLAMFVYTPFLGIACVVTVILSDDANRPAIFLTFFLSVIFLSVFKQVFRSLRYSPLSRPIFL